MLDWLDIPVETFFIVSWLALSIALALVEDAS